MRRFREHHNQPSTPAHGVAGAPGAAGHAPLGPFQCWRSALWSGVFGAAGVLHFLKPEPFDTLIPTQLPGSPRAWTIGSGVIELGLGASIAATSAVPALRPYLSQVAGPASALFLLAVWPGNIKMAWDWRAAPPVKRWVAFARVPLQLQMIASVLRLGR